VASTTAGRQVTEAHRAAQLAARAGSLENLLRLWAIVDPANLAGTIDTFAQAAAILAGDGWNNSAGIASRYYGLFRRAEGVPGAATSIIAPRPRTDALAGLIRGSALSGIIDARRAGQSPDLAKASALKRVMGTVSKIILTGGRRTIIGSTLNDRQALGWGRVTSGDPCAFCRMLASRGAVYKNEKAAEFEAHDSCACTAEALYRGDAIPEQSTAYAREWAAAQRAAREDGTASKGTANDALNNYRRYLAGGGNTDGGTPE
jgi:hypothetical protein